jgi:hypothetical protein
MKTEESYERPQLGQKTLARIVIAAIIGIKNEMLVSKIKKL